MNLMSINSTVKFVGKTIVFKRNLLRFVYFQNLKHAVNIFRYTVTFGGSKVLYNRVWIILFILLTYMICLG